MEASPFGPALRAIAAAAGVGKSTAARALAGAGDVAPETRARVLAVAQEMGWTGDTRISGALERERRRGVGKASGLKPRVTLRDVARAAGVSGSTVARVVHGRTGVRAAVRARVREAMERLGFRQDPALVALRRHQQRQRRLQRRWGIALLTLDRGDGAWRERYPGFMGVAVMRMEGRARELGYTFEATTLRPFDSPGEAGRVLFHRGFGGLVLGAVPDEERIDDFPWTKFATVMVGQERPEFRVSRVDTHWMHVVEVAVGKARELGYKRVGYVLVTFEGKASDRAQRAQCLLHRSEWEERGEEQPPLFLVGDIRGLSYDEGLRVEGARFKAWLERWRPDVVVGTNGMFFYWLKDVGWHVPRDAGFISLVKEYSDQNIRFASVDWNPIQFGARTIDLLHDQLMRGERGFPALPLTVLIEVGWNEGWTTGRGSCAGRA